MGVRIRVGVAVALCAAVAGCKDEVAAPAPVRPVMSVIVSSAEARNVVIVGTVQPQIKTDFSFRTLGRLIARPVNVGDTVREGETLAAIDPAALELAVRSASAELSKSQAQLANASGTEDRQRTLLEKNVTSKATFETAEQATAAAQSTLVRAQSNLTKAREQLGYAQLKSDFSGVVTFVGAEIGQVVSPGQTVVTIARPDIAKPSSTSPTIWRADCGSACPSWSGFSLIRRSVPKARFARSAPERPSDAEPARSHHA